MLIAFCRFITTAKRRDQVGDAVEILTIRQTQQLDPWRFGAAQSGFARIEGIINVARYGRRVGANACARIIIGHVSLDIFSELVERAIALHRPFVLAFDAFAVASMTFRAALDENLPARAQAFGGKKTRRRDRQPEAEKADPAKFSSENQTSKHFVATDNGTTNYTF